MCKVPDFESKFHEMEHILFLQITLFYVPLNKHLLQINHKTD